MADQPLAMRTVWLCVKSDVNFKVLDLEIRQSPCLENGIS
jgi:hypothetical protein